MGSTFFSEAHTFEAEKGINILISSSSQALNTEPYPFLLHDQCTKIGVQVEVERGHAPELSQAFLYGNEILLAHTLSFLPISNMSTIHWALVITEWHGILTGM